MAEFDNETTKPYIVPPHMEKASTDDNSLGNILVRAHAITDKQLREALVMQYVKEENEGKRTPLGEILVLKGYIKPRQLKAATDRQGMVKAKKPAERNQYAMKIASAGVASSSSLGDTLDVLIGVARDIASKSLG